MPVVLTRLCWESGKEASVTGKGLSEALNKCHLAQTAADNENTGAAWKNAEKCLRAVVDEIKKNQAKVPKTLTKTHTLLKQLLALAQNRLGFAITRAKSAADRAGAVAKVQGFQASLAQLAGKAQSGMGALTKLRKDITDILATPAAQNAAAKQKLHDHLENTVVKPYQTAYATALNMPGTISSIVEMHPVDSFTPAEKAILKAVGDNADKVRTALNAVKDSMEAELKRLK